MSFINSLFAFQLCVCTHICKIACTCIHFYSFLWRHWVRLFKAGESFCFIIVYIPNLRFRVPLQLSSQKLQILPKGFLVFLVKLLKAFPTKHCSCSIEGSPCNVWYTHNSTGNVHRVSAFPTVLYQDYIESLIMGDGFKLENNWLPNFCRLFLEASLYQRK